VTMRKQTSNIQLLIQSTAEHWALSVEFYPELLCDGLTHLER
jgi:hypothetical protein